jgi:hypothetical protein
MDKPEGKRRAAVLPYDTHFARWRRARERSRFIHDELRKNIAEGKMTFPEWFSVDCLERQCTAVLADCERVSEEIRREEEQ